MKFKLGLTMACMALLECASEQRHYREECICQPAVVLVVSGAPDAGAPEANLVGYPGQCQSEAAAETTCRLAGEVGSYVFTVEAKGYETQQVSLIVEADDGAPCGCAFRTEKRHVILREGCGPNPCGACPANTIPSERCVDRMWHCLCLSR